MATQSVKQQSEPKPMSMSIFRRRVSLKGPIAKRLAGDFPRYMVDADGTVDELSHGERALMRFWRALPKDLEAELSEILTLTGDEFKAALLAFGNQVQQRRAEMPGWFGDAA